MITNAHFALQKGLREILQNLKVVLHDSPLSYKSHVDTQKGYYLGYCHAANWETDLDFLIELENI